MPPLGLRRPGSILALLLLAGCAGLRGAGDPVDGLQLRFEEVEAPEVFERQGSARPGDPEAPPGLWAAVSGLPRAETGLVENLASGTRVRVALFQGRRGAGPIVLSAEASAALGIGADAVPVRVVALRNEPLLTLPANRF